MSELGPRARELVHSGRGRLNRPTVADRARVQIALQAKLGAAVLPAEVSSPAPVARPRWPFISSAVVGAALIGGGLLLVPRHEQRGTNAPSARSLVVPVAASSAAVPVATAGDTPSPTPATPPAMISAEPPAPSVRPAQDRLAQEVALLARATSDLHAGRAANALKVLDEYQRQFPKGLLTEERRAARAQALCALGRQSEAQAELARLAPQSPAAARAKQVCETHSTTGR